VKARRVGAWMEHRLPGVHRAVQPAWRLWRDYAPPAAFDLVVCLQGLERLEDSAPFARKLLATGRTLLRSVPYRWPAGRNLGHLQDPVDEDRLARRVGRSPPTAGS